MSKIKKTNLQKRAERAAGLFRDKARKPLVIEFAGVPKAGKTTTLTQVQAFLKRCGFRTDVMVERASVCPAVFLMLSSPADAMKREQSVLPVMGDGGSIMNVDVLRQVRAVNKECAELLRQDFRIFQVDTSEGDTRDDPKRTAEVVADLVIGLIEEHIAEEILSFPKELVTEAFGDKNFIAADRAQRFLLGSDQSDFQIRDQVEDDRSRVQALPIVLIRNADGDVLRLRRRERSHENPLHDKVVLWAGGHVRREDADNGDPLLRCAVRELEEELRLQIRLSDLVPIGAVYFDNGGSTSKHVAIAYEWRSVTNDVSVVLSRSEFFERRGTSLSGSFATVDKLVDDVRTKRLKEPWSVELIREHLAKESFGENLGLFNT